MTIFKYFTHEAHALALMEKGELMMQSLSHFRAREADGIRGDSTDGCLIYRPTGGLVMNMDDGRVITLEDGSFRSTANQNDTFVYCASNSMSLELAEKFGCFCVEIFGPEELARRLKMRAYPKSRLDYEQLVHGKVAYRNHHEEPGVDWALPERLALIKDESFTWQDEYRFAVGRRGTMKVQNVGVTIQIGDAPPIARQVSNPIFLRIGMLTELRLHRLCKH